MDRNQVPNMGLANYSLRLISLRTTALAAKATAHFTGNPSCPIDPAKTDILPRDMFCHHDLDLPTEHVSTHTHTYKRYDSLRFPLTNQNSPQHKHCKWPSVPTRRSTTLLFAPRMYFDNYLSKREALRKTIIACNYPDIANLKTTVECMVNGLCVNSDTITTGRFCNTLGVIS